MTIAGEKAIFDLPNLGARKYSVPLLPKAFSPDRTLKRELSAESLMSLMSLMIRKAQAV